MSKPSECIGRLMAAGIAFEDAAALRRIAMTLHRWHELECGIDGGVAQSIATIERDGDEDDSPPFYRLQYPTRDGYVDKRWRIADRETGARKRLGKIVSKYPGFSAYVQTDPRGAALYILRPGDVPEGADVSSVYSRGIAVYK